MGIDFYVRSRVNIFTTAAAIRAYGVTTAAATDCGGSLFWNKSFARHASGSSKVFYNQGDAELYGDKMSAVTRAGGVAARNDGKGIINLVEAVSA
jgi:hypothetical protein